MNLKMQQALKQVQFCEHIHVTIKIIQDLYMFVELCD